MVTDTLRRRLFEAAARVLGAEEAEALMELLPPAGWGDLVRQVDLREARAELRGEIAELRGGIAELRGEVRAQLGRLVAANMASMLGVAALVAAIVKIG